MTASGTGTHAPQQRPAVLERGSYEQFALQEAFIVPLLHERIGALLQSRGSFHGGRALDVGCGRQPLRKQIESLGYEYFGLDVQQNPEGTVEVIAALDAPLPSAAELLSPFDLVVCTEVLEHVADWRTAFENLSALTKSGAHVLITCPHVYPLHEEPFDFWRPTIHALRHFAEAYGFRVVHLQSAGSAWHVLGTVLANCFPLQTSQSWRSWILTKLVRLVRREVLRLLLAERLRSWVHLDSSLYQSNVAVLERL